MTLVERKTLYTVIMRLTGKRSDLLAEIAVKGMKALTSKVKTITLDNGLEEDRQRIGSSDLLRPSLRLLGTGYQ